MILERTAYRYGILKIFFQRNSEQKHWVIVGNRAILIRINNFYVTLTSVMRTDFTIVDRPDDNEVHPVIATEAIKNFTEEQAIA